MYQVSRSAKRTLLVGSLIYSERIDLLMVIGAGPILIGNVINLGRMRSDKRAVLHVLMEDRWRRRQYRR